MQNKWAKILSFGTIVLVLMVWLHNVPKYISENNRESLSLIFTQEIVNAEELNFNEQIRFIDELVKTLHQDFVVGVPIAYNQHREPAELIKNNGGLCYDFSRTIEKQLILNGFETRHVAVYVKKDNFWNTITTTGVYSHSLTEVKTKRGWMIVDSNVPFYAQDEQGLVYSFKDLNKLANPPKWKINLHEDLVHFYKGNIVFVYGLYSRHGKFYPPYNIIPDFNFRELLYNL